MPAGHLSLGRRGEEAAAAHRAARGYAVLARNWRGRGGELDIVCQRRGTLVFAEVKTRTAGQMATPHDALTPAKRRNLARAAGEWRTAHDAWDRPCRFDLLAVVEDRGRMAVEHVENAFDLSPGSGSGGEGGWQPW